MISIHDWEFSKATYETSKAIISVVWLDEIIFALKLDSIIILSEIYEEHDSVYKDFYQGITVSEAAKHENH